MNDLQKRTWAEVSLGAIENNYKAIRKRLPEGCKFHPRCPYATEACKSGTIPPVRISESHMVRCKRFSDSEV